MTFAAKKTFAAVAPRATFMYVFISRELWLDFCKCSFCEAWQDSRGFALFFSPLFCPKDRPEAGNSGWQRSPRVVEETANGSRWLAKAERKPVQRTYATLSYK